MVRPVMHCETHFRFIYSIAMIILLRLFSILADFQR